MSNPSQYYPEELIIEANLKSSYPGHRYNIPIKIRIEDVVEIMKTDNLVNDVREYIKTYIKDVVGFTAYLGGQHLCSTLMDDKLKSSYKEKKKRDSASKEIKRFYY